MSVGSVHETDGAACVRGSLKLLHNSYLFLQEVAGLQDKFTDDASYEGTWKELLASATLESHLDKHQGFQLLYSQLWRMSSCQLRHRPNGGLCRGGYLCSAGRFDDHRGIVPAELEVTESGLLGKLKRSSVTGPDTKLNFRLLVIHSSAYVHQKLWMLTGWQLLEKEAPYSRDYLLPAPSNNYHGFKYQVAFAVQTRILQFEQSWSLDIIFPVQARSATDRPRYTATPWRMLVADEYLLEYGGSAYR